MEEWTGMVEARLNQAEAVGSVRYRLLLEGNDEPGLWRIRLVRTHHGIETKIDIQKAFFASPEYRRIAELASDLSDLIGEDGSVRRGEKTRAVGTFREAVEWLMNQARKGQSVQRYKGLGEMNPDQLWETTINPESRRLMQVRIEDAVAADEIFTTLMGDHVEPRREFIEKNALSASNLDV
jgi:DNA gyrase subunit B